MQPDSVTGFVWYAKKAISTQFQTELSFFHEFLLFYYAFGPKFLYHSIVLNYVCLTFTNILTFFFDQSR